MAEGQVAQAFGKGPESAVDFKTETGLGVKVFVRPGAMFCRDIEKWLKDNEVHEFQHSITQFDGQIAAIITYRKKDAIRTEEIVRDTVELLLVLTKQIADISEILTGGNDSKPQE